MPFALNSSRNVASLRPEDGVRIDAVAGPRGFDRICLDLSARAADTHCLVALPALANVFSNHSGPIRVWAKVSYDEADGARLPFVFYLAAYRDGKPIGEERVRYFAGREPCALVLDTSIPADADQYQLVIYADRNYRGALQLRDLRLVAGRREYRLAPEGHIVSEITLDRRWRQEGTRLLCESAYGEHWAEMPVGWRFDTVHPTALAAAEWILFSEVDRFAFGVKTPPPDPDDGERRYVGPNTLLSFSLGTDSTAAMTLMPEKTVRYYCRRPYTSYLISSGARVTLPDPAPWEERLSRVPNLFIVPNTFEQIRVTAGGRHGFAHPFGYAAIGLLLADHSDAGVLAFGSVMEQVFLRSGNLFADVVALQSSAYNGLRRLVNGAGLFLALPTAGCSEVLTSRIADTGRYAGLAISCPRARPDGTPCGTCFKCFRKLRLELGADAPDPDEGVVHLLEKYPLKSATSVIYATQRTGFRHAATDEYQDVDLEFLERYFDYAVEHMLPNHLSEHARRELDALGIAPMSEEDELRLRTIGQIFWPESFSWSRAGVAEPDATRSHRS